MHDGVGMEERLALTEVIYDELIHAILTMVDRLDLTATKVAADDTVCRHILIFWTYSYFFTKYLFFGMDSDFFILYILFLFLHFFLFKFCLLYTLYLIIIEICLCIKK